MKSETTNLNPTQIAESQKKCKHVPVIIVLAVLAASGIGFGGFELWQNMQKDNDIKNLQAKSTETEGEKEPVENEGVNTEENEEQIKNKEKTEETVDPENYIYLSEWGVKIKKPDEKINEIIYNNGYPTASTSYSVKFENEDHECSGYFLDVPQGKVCNHVRIMEALNADAQDEFSHIVDVEGVKLEIAFPVFGASEEIEKYFSDASNYSKI